VVCHMALDVDSGKSQLSEHGETISRETRFCPSNRR
jgi:hypothetical protein